MQTSPVRNPAFLLLCVAALASAVAARQSNPIEALVVEEIQSRYVTDRVLCQAMAGGERRQCMAVAEVRFDVALAELKRLRNEPETAVPKTGMPHTPTANAALEAGASPS